jgi:hypothetical protein
MHIFISSQHPDVFGFTLDKTGANLPTELAPWKPSQGALEVASNMRLCSIITANPVIAAVKKDGFYLARSEMVSGPYDG